MVKSLEDQRKYASDESGGISNDTIYDLMRKLVINKNLKGDLLDFGAGIGQLTTQLYNLNCFSSITAVDLLPRPYTVDKCVNWTAWDLNNQTNFPDQSFDIIVSAEVIEHLENPRATIREWYRLLRPKGALIFSTPNNESWRSLLALLFQGHFVSFGDQCYPAHITPLLRKDIQRILKETGFDQPDFIFTNIGGIPKLPHITWQSVSANLLQGIRYSDNLLVFTNKL